MTDSMFAPRHGFFLVVFILLWVSTPAQTHDASQQEHALLQAAAAQWENQQWEQAVAT